MDLGLQGKRASGDRQQRGAPIAEGVSVARRLLTPNPSPT
jgi:hypothetical protein